ncbi:sensor histidine kinase [Bellilinea sp.]|uniref:sensor histidine kinase n=1 Tax=Bellilinea sp. TaxID=2838785 RepID=UPI002ADDAB6B|nr:ATP-binding protein [Bellilinea sp.]
MRSLTVKLTLAFLVVGVTGALLVAVFINRRIQSAFDRFLLTREEQAMISALLEYYQFNGSWEGIDNALLRRPRMMMQGMGGMMRTMEATWTRFTLVDAERRVLFSISAGEPSGSLIPASELNRAVELSVNNQTVGWVILNAKRRALIADTPEAVFLRGVNQAALVSAVIASLLALALGGFLAYGLTRSLRELTHATEEIARGNYGKEVAVRSNDELGTLAQAFNKMSRDLANAVRLRRQMTADIAHELRSPLTVLSGYAEALSEGKLKGNPEIYNVLHQETRQLSRLIDDLRLLSLADAGELSLLIQPTDIPTLLNQIITRHSVTAQQKQIDLQAVVSPGLPKYPLDPDRIAQVLDNLILNAFRYTPAGGWIRLSAEISPSGGLRLKVQDNGSGIAEDDLPFIFERFYRADKARHSNQESGLGLAIARSIVEAHGGKITAESQPGKGTTFTIDLPPT